MNKDNKAINLGPVRFTRLSPEIDAEIQRRAKKSERPVAYVIRKLIEKALGKAA